jgi:hypothetical protein
MALYVASDPQTAYIALRLGLPKTGLRSDDQTAMSFCYF